MIWHIFKKDWKLLWRLTVGVALVHFALAAVLFKTGRFGAGPTLGRMVDPLIVIGMLGTAFLIAAVVHQDAIPGVRQDWLVRPVKRRDLLLAKVFSVLAMVQGPMLAADFLEALANGFPLGESLAAAVGRSGYILVGFTLPLFALASLTRNFMEAIVGGLAVFMGGTIFMMLFQRGGPIFVTLGTGVQWAPESAWFALTLLGVTAVLTLQYFRRKTLPARWLMGTTALLCLCTAFIPWQAAFAIQQQRAARPGSSNAVVMAFEPGQGKLQTTAGINGDVLNSRSRIREGDVFVYLPLRIAGLADDTVLRADHSEVRLITPDRGAKSLESFDNLEVRKEGHDEGEKRIRYGIHVPSDILALINDQPVRLEIDYSLTLFGLTSSHSLPALNGDQRMPDMGWCATKVNLAATSVTLRCLEAGKTPSCGTLFLEHTPSGRRNPAISFCSPDYAPYLRQRSIPDAMGRFGRNLPFRDPTGLAHYPVDGSQLAESQVVLRSYQPMDHFTRRLVIPEIRLKDWASGLGF
jgi:hypothetical protein